MRGIKAVGLMAKPNSELAAKVVPELLSWLDQRGITVRYDQESAAYLGRDGGVPRNDVAKGVDLVIVLGGDGTLLSAARAVGRTDIPIFAVNLGSLGFLTSIAVGELYSELERALQGDFRIGRRRMLHCELWRGNDCVATYEALNDVVFTKKEIARMIELETRVDNHFVCVYKADGLILATPTGSTAYSLAAGGPIVFPQVSALCITPICPHTLTNRPVIVPDESIIQIVALDDDDNQTYLTVDGQIGELLRHNDRVVCQRSDNSISLIRPPQMLFFDVLRKKLHWGER
jgi:NAD+ kinase